MVAGMWWFFTLIMISSYTANLAGKIVRVNHVIFHSINFSFLDLLENGLAN